MLSISFYRVETFERLTMRIEIQKWGNSAALRLNQGLLQQVSTKIGDEFEVEVIDGGLFLKPVSEPEYVLADLLATCTPENVKLDAEGNAWLNEPPIGREML